MRDLLVEYVDEQTPDEAPPFEYVEHAVRERRRRKYVVSAAVGAVVVVAGIIAGIGVPRALREPVAPETTTPTAPAPWTLDEGPPPQEFKIGATRLLLRGEVAVTAVTPDPRDTSALIVKLAPDELAVEPCAPNTVVRVLSQDALSIRVAAYRYGVGPDQKEGHLCAQRTSAPTQLRVGLRSPLEGRTVYAGSTGQRAVLN